MKSIIIIYEDEIGKIIPFVPSQINISPNDNVFIDDFNFDVNSPLDFVDYLRYHEITEYIIFSNGKRINKIVNFVNSFATTIFHIFDFQANLIAGNKDVLEDELQVQIQNYLSENLGFFSSPYTLEEDIHQLITADYPFDYRNNLIKHIHISSRDSLEYIHSTVFENCSMNSIIFTDYSNDIDNYFPIKCATETINKYIDKYKKESKEEIMLSVANFREKGEVNRTWLNIPIDYFSLLEMSRNNRLFYSNQRIYRDFQNNDLLSKRLDTTYSQIINFNSYFKKKNFNPEEQIFPYLINVSKHLKAKRKLHLITPYNILIHADRWNSYTYFNLIGIIADEKFYILNNKNNIKYEVPKQFLILLEFYLKENLDSKQLKNYFPNKLQQYKDSFFKFMSKIEREQYDKLL
ncbi:hypothetical protein [Lentibacillus sp. CBA3610]|uniref:hypothetical protein n=1 Tax=Lentibacillus sp. CBA3610 TaxID=2518176 RepID=UPI001595790F|nr:hypothetical protein [Lentibacillus sp. CBA3610]QKY71286.1 hypothetical protein Len3610_18565 [Lentibacillus sp. CBA3610]